MAALTKDAILVADDLPREAVEIKEWGGTVYVRSMSAAERDEWEASWLADDGKPKTARERLKNLRARLAVLVLVDDSGNRLFADEDADALGKKAAPATAIGTSASTSRTRNEVSTKRLCRKR